MVSTQYGKQIKALRWDNAKELMQESMLSYYKKQGTLILPSTAYTAHQNGVAESSNRLAEDKVRCMTLDAPPCLQEL
jgi:hypothetical protein